MPQIFPPPRLARYFPGHRRWGHPHQPVKPQARICSISPSKKVCPPTRYRITPSESLPTFTSLYRSGPQVAHLPPIVVLDVSVGIAAQQQVYHKGFPAPWRSFPDLAGRAAADTAGGIGRASCLRPPCAGTPEAAAPISSHLHTSLYRCVPHGAFVRYRHARFAGRVKSAHGRPWVFPGAPGESGLIRFSIIITKSKSISFGAGSGAYIHRHAKAVWPPPPRWIQAIVVNPVNGAVSRLNILVPVEKLPHVPGTPSGRRIGLMAHLSNAQKPLHILHGRAHARHILGNLPRRALRPSAVA